MAYTERQKPSLKVAHTCRNCGKNFRTLDALATHQAAVSTLFYRENHPIVLQDL